MRSIVCVIGDIALELAIARKINNARWCSLLNLLNLIPLGEARTSRKLVVLLGQPSRKLHLGYPRGAEAASGRNNRLVDEER